MKTRKPRHPARSDPSPGAAARSTGPPATMPAPVRQMLQAPRPQPKLTVTRPGDASEREADQVADHVMRLPEPGRDRVADLFADGDRAAGRPTGGEIHRKSAGSPGPNAGGPDPAGTVAAPLAARLAALGSGGQPLASEVRSFFEPRFGRDLGEVRVHTDPAAGELARSMDARAFTLGRSVVFGPGEYAPGSAAGRHLIAHELTHVLQQTGSVSAPAASPETPALSSGGVLPVLHPSGTSDDEVCRQTQQRQPDALGPSPYDEVQDFVRKAGRAWNRNKEYFALALRRFQRRMQMTSEAATVPDVGGALVRHAIQQVTGAALARVETLLPGWSEVKGALDVMVGELERADTAAQELRLRDFLDVVDTAMTRGFLAQVDAIEAGQAALWEIYASLPPDVGPMFLASFDNWLVRIDEEVPSDSEYEAALYLGWVNRHRRQLRRYTSLGRLEIRFNAERPRDYRFESATVLSSYSDKVAEGLNWVMRTPELGMPNVLHLPIDKVVGLYTENLAGGRSYGWAHLDERNRTVQWPVQPVARQRWQEMPWEAFVRISELSG
jgi:hypothetical protein